MVQSSTPSSIALGQIHCRTTPRILSYPTNVSLAAFRLPIAFRYPSAAPLFGSAYLLRTLQFPHLALQFRVWYDH
jgi:hypothetical protein